MSQINVNNIRAKDGVGAVGFPGGINATGVVTATTFKGALEGNVTGNLTGNVTGNTSGSAGSLAAGATGSDLTLSGNLTVNGTTTTIDTAVTAVDSLAVDGNITALGRLGIGTDNPNSVLPLTIAGLYPGIQFKDTQGTTDFNLNADNNSFKIQTGVAGAGPVEKFSIDQHGTTKFSGPLTEKCNRDGGAGLTGNYVHHLKTYGNVHWATNNSSGTWTYDITGDGSTDLNDMMTDQETLSFQLISSQNNANYYMTELRIDGSNAHTVWWQGGSAPSAGGASGYDVYTFTIFKRLNASFRIFASLSNHA